MYNRNGEKMKSKANSTQKSIPLAKRRSLMCGVLCIFCLHAPASFDANDMNTEPEGSVSSELLNTEPLNQPVTAQPEERNSPKLNESASNSEQGEPCTEDESSSGEEDEEDLQEQRREKEEKLEKALNSIISKRTFLLNATEIYDTLVDYLEFTASNDLYSDLKLVADLVTSDFDVLSQDENKIKKLTRLIVKNYDRIIMHSNDPSGATWSNFSCDDLRQSAGQTLASFLERLIIAGDINTINLQLDSPQAEQDRLNDPLTKKRKFISYLVRACCRRDERRRHSITDRFETLLNLTSSGDKGIDTVPDLLYQLISAKTYNIEYRLNVIFDIISTARASGRKISPLSKSSCPPSDTILDFVMDETADTPSLEIGYLTLYLLVLAVRDEKETPLEGTIIKSLISNSRKGIDKTSRIKCPSILKYQIIKQILIYELLKNNIHSTIVKEEENLEAEVRDAIDNILQELMRYVDKYKEIHPGLIMTKDDEIFKMLLREFGQFITTQNREANEVCHILERVFCKRRNIIIEEDFLPVSGEALLFCRKELNPRLRYEKEHANGLIDDFYPIKEDEKRHADAECVDAYLCPIKEDDKDYANTEYIDDCILEDALVVGGLTYDEVRRRYQRILSMDYFSASLKDSMSAIISYYDMLSIAFIKTGNGELLEAMKSDSSTAIQKIYDCINQELGGVDKWDENMEDQFATLLHILNKDMHEGEEYVKHLWKPIDKEQSKFENDEYDLREVLNFMLNYAVYGTGTGAYAFQHHTPYPDKHKDPLIHLIIKFFLPIKITMVRKKYSINCIFQTVDAINSCLENKEAIMRVQSKSLLNENILKDIISNKINRNEITNKLSESSSSSDEEDYQGKPHPKCYEDGENSQDNKVEDNRVSMSSERNGYNTNDSNNSLPRDSEHENSLKSDNDSNVVNQNATHTTHTDENWAILGVISAVISSPWRITKWLLGW